MATPGWLAAVIRTPCVIHFRDPAGVDEYGDVTYDETRTLATTCWIQPVSQQEIQNGRAEVGSFLVHFGADMAAQLNGFARLEVAGVSYEVVGPPAVYPDIDTGAVHHVEAYVISSTA